VSLLPADLYALGQDLRLAAGRRRRRHRRRFLTAAAALLAATTAAVAVGASTLLGGPAPPAVQIDLATAVRFAVLKHPDLDVRTAHVVATSKSATLYSVTANNGDYCSELIGAAHGAIYGFTCSVQQRAPDGRFHADAYAPSVSYFDDADGSSPPVVQFGRLPATTVSARAVYDDGSGEQIHPGLDRFFIYEPSARYQRLARRMPMTLEFRDKDNLTWSYYLEPPQPLRIEGRRISGRVLIDRAARVELDVAPRARANPDRILVPIHADRTFSWTRRPGSVVYRVTVRDAENVPVSADTSVVTLSTIRRQFAALRRR
jgi:hypothetical protein